MLSDVMSVKINGMHVGLLRQVTGKKERRKNDGSWKKAASDSVLQGAGTQPLQTYIGRRQAIVEEWVALWPILRYEQRIKANR